MADEADANVADFEGWLGDTVGLGVFAYIFVVIAGFNDSVFVKNGPALQASFGIEIPIGSITLPAVSFPVTVLEFFVIAPLVALAVHAMLLLQLRQRLLQGQLRPRTDAVLIPAIAFLGPAIVLAIQIAYAPFSSIQPSGASTAGWLLVFHCLCITVAAALTIGTLFVEGSGRGNRPSPTLALQAGVLFGVLAWCATAASQAFPLLPTSPPEAKDLTGFVTSFESGENLYIIAGAAFLAPILALGISGLIAIPHRKVGSIPMSFRIFLIALFAAAASNLAAARSIDLSGEVLMGRVPGDQIVQAYMSAAELNTMRDAWLDAHLDFGRELDLAGWNLGEARFRNTVLVRTNFSGATLDGASFAGADLVGTMFDNASLIGAQFNQARFRKGEYRLAQVESDPLHATNASGTAEESSQPNLDGVSFRGANLTRAVFSAVAGPPPGKTWGEFCKTEYPQGGDRSVWLRGADFENAILDGAFLQGVNGSDVMNLTKAASLKGAKLNCAKLQCLDFTAFKKADALDGLELNGADLRGAKFPKGHDTFFKSAIDALFDNGPQGKPEVKCVNDLPENVNPHQ